MNISVIIVNYNTADLVKSCIDSVLSQERVTVETIVVDNASQDDSVHILEKYGDRIHLIVSLENLGFGGANNLAFKQSTGHYVFLLNPDAVFQTKHDLYDMFMFMEKNKNYGMAGTKILEHDGASRVFPNSMYPGQKYLQTPLPAMPGEIAWILGASMIFRREVYDVVGGFDKKYFLYGEDIDICFRVRKAGWAIGYNEAVAVLHVGGASERKTQAYDLWCKKQKALELFFTEHYSQADVFRLVKRDFYRATGRFFVLWLRKKTIGLNQSNQQKFFKYQAIRDVAWRFLNNANR